MLLFPEGTINSNGERIGILQDVSAEFEMTITHNDPGDSRTKITIVARAISIGQWPLPESFEIKLTGPKVIMTLYKCSMIKLHDPDIGGNHRFLSEPDPNRNNHWGTIKENNSCP